ncbi:Protein SRC2 [Cardamine amara subsp. amara]|uniref:Protein SRC2 n=1 Tax=Cardamine amara subsp. amara TaxID=228776 RepID=A0ABD0Z255_CARAN
MSMMFPSFQLLELNIISAQDLAPVSRKMKTYAVAWVHSERKLTTRVDYNGGANPTWNDKFVFRVNEEFLYADTSAVVIEIYALHWFRDVHVGTVRVLVSNLIPPDRRPGYRASNNEYGRTPPPPGMRFVALQVRRTSGRPQGILNIGVGVLDGSMRSMPLYTHMDSSAVGYRDLLGEKDHHLQHLHLNSNKGSSKNPQSPSSRQYQSVISRPELRRTKSDTSSMVVSDLLSRAERSRLANRKPASALVSSESETIPNTTDSDATKSNEYSPPIQNPHIMRQRYDSIESDLIDPSPREKPHVVVPRRERHDVPPNGSYHQSRKTPRRTTMNERQRSFKDYDRGRASPYLSRHGTPLRSNIVSSTPMRSNGVGSTPMRSNMVAMSPLRPNINGMTPMRTPMRSNMVGTTPMRSNIVGSTPIRSNYMATPMKTHHDYGTPMRSNLAGRRILTESELGPSPSEVAAKMAKDRSHTNETESSILSEWSFDESSIEGLRSKLDRWRTELPPLYDIGSSHVSSSDYDGAIVPAGGGMSSRRKTPAGKKHNRRHTEGGNGLFSCFSKICGVECSFVCGGGGPVGSDGSTKKGGAGRVQRTYSADDLSFV